MTTEMHVFANAETLSVAAADAVAATVGEAVAATGRCRLVLSGGNTPRLLYGVLSLHYRNRIPWDRVHVFWGDERYVPYTDLRSNYRAAAETLLDHVPCPSENVHPMPTHFAEPDDAARAYEATLRECFAAEPPWFDLVLLGLGADGHTASLFPGSPALDEQERWAVAVSVDAEPPVRLTLTFPVLTAAARTFFLVSGPGKAGALRDVLADDADPRRLPAAGLRRSRGRVSWWVDRDAAAHVTT